MTNGVEIICFLWAIQSMLGIELSLIFLKTEEVHLSVYLILARRLLINMIL